MFGPFFKAPELLTCAAAAGVYQKGFLLKGTFYLVFFADVVFLLSLLLLFIAADVPTGLKPPPPASVREENPSARDVLKASALENG